MALTKITYENKVDRRTSALAVINKVTAADMTEIKTVVNVLCDAVDALQETVDSLDLGIQTCILMLNQSSTNPPTSTEKINQLSGTIVWSYIGVGTFIGTLAGAFPENRTVITPPHNDGWLNLTVYSVSRVSNNAIQLTTGILDATTGEVTASNGRLYDDFSYLKIEILPE